MQLYDLLNNDSHAKQYFSSLPAHVKETMMQSGVDFETEEHLRQCAEQMINKERQD